MSLELRSLSVRYGRRLAVDDVSLTAQPGEILAIIGANGSGKSSLLKAIAGLVPAEGRVILNPGPERQDHLGYMPQDNGTRAALSVIETVLLGRLGKLGLSVTTDDLACARQTLDSLGIASLAERPLVELSGGQRQLVFLAQALAGDPVVLLLDEPISALDIRNQLEVMETIARLTHEKHLVTLVVLHDLNIAARFAQRIALFREGRLLCCAPVEQALTDARLRQAFGIEAAIARGCEGHLIVEPLRMTARPLTTL